MVDTRCGLMLIQIVIIIINYSLILLSFLNTNTICISKLLFLVFKLNMSKGRSISVFKWT